MPTSCDASGRSAPPPGLALPVASAVAQDLEAIFPREVKADVSQALRLRGRRRRRGGDAEPRPRSILSAGSVGALAAAALAGMSAGAYLDAGHAPPAREKSEQVVLTSNPSSPGSSLPNPGPLPAGPMHAPPPQIIVATSKPTAAPPEPAKLHKASAKQRRHAAPTRRASCRGAYCRAPTVMEADARLRRAYDAAHRAGVSSTVLTDYHDRWESLRHRARQEPRLVATRYEEMAGDLNRMTARHAAEDTRSRHGAWYNFRTQIASLLR